MRIIGLTVDVLNSQCNDKKIPDASNKTLDSNTSARNHTKDLNDVLSLKAVACSWLVSRLYGHSIGVTTSCPDLSSIIA